MSFKKLFCIVVSLVLIVTFSACSKDSQPTETKNTTESSSEYVNISDNNMFTDNDKEIGYDSSTSVTVALADSGIVCESTAVTVNGKNLTITDEGTYVLSGSLSGGSVTVDAEKTDKVTLILDNVSITADNTAPIYIKQADKVFVTTTANSENSLIQQGEFVNNGDDNIDSVIFSKDDITLNGAGKLTLSTSNGHGIVSKDDLAITSGSYEITASSHALSGKDCVKIAEGTFLLTSGKDGIHAENADDADMGYIYISGGSFTMNCTGDGIDSSAYIQIDNGNFNILAGGGSANGETQYESFGGPGMSYYGSSTDTVSTKAIKATGKLVINSGEFTLDSADDAIHSNSDSLVTGGSFVISTGDDGIHADGNTTVSGGNIVINTSYEGIEGQSIDIKGGDITLTASDDGLNAAGGNDESGYGGFMQNDIFANDENAYINISGGKLVVKADGDGIDSNGDITVSGGETYVEGPQNSANGSLDYGGEAKITGGIFLSAGAIGMAENFSQASSQGVIMLTTSGSGGEISVSSNDGTLLLSYTPGINYSSIIISCPSIVKGNTYSVTASGSTQRITMSSTVYGSSGGMGGFGGMGGMGGFGGNQGRR